MKTLLKYMLFLGLAIQLNAQSKEAVPHKFFSHPEVEKGVEFNQSILVFNVLNLMVTPQFDGLFHKSFKSVNGINRLENFYNDFNLGYNLGIDYDINNRLKLKSVYNIGMLKFNQSNLPAAERYVVKLSICYVF